MEKLRKKKRHDYLSYYIFDVIISLIYLRLDINTLKYHLFLILSTKTFIDIFCLLNLIFRRILGITIFCTFI